jgi:hypothetical protein
VVEVPFARHDSWFSRVFEDLVVYDAISSSKLAAARRYGVSWRAVDHMCVRVATEALDRVDLLEGLVAIAIDEVKYKKGQRYWTVICDRTRARHSHTPRAAAPRPSRSPSPTWPRSLPPSLVTGQPAPSSIGLQMPGSRRCADDGRKGSRRQVNVTPEPDPDTFSASRSQFDGLISFLSNEECLSLEHAELETVLQRARA